MPFRKQEGLIDAIRMVAIYARLSRGESEKDLDRHLSVIKDICKENNWKYLIYPEIGSGESIAGRPKFQELLRDVQEEMFDAVFVYDYDRLGRGSGTDQDTILKSFQETDTLVITANPFSIYNTNDECDEETIEFKGFMARREYKMIRKRLEAGKKISFKMGRWSTGYAPFGYKINQQLKKLEVHEENAKIFRDLIVGKYLKGYSSVEIRDMLNERGIISVRGGKWSSHGVLYALKNRTYLGNIYYNRRYQDKERKGQIKPPEQWSVTENTHTALLTIEEYDQIIKELRSRGGSGEKGVNALGSMIKCFNCDSPMIIKTRNGVKSVGKCMQCDMNRGGSIEIVQSSIYDSVSALKDALEKETVQYNFTIERDALEEDVKRLDSQLQTALSAIENIEKAFEIGMYTPEKAMERIEERRGEIKGIKDTLRKQKTKLNQLEGVDEEEKLKHVDAFLKEINYTSDERELRSLYRSIIKDITWQRDVWDEIYVTVNFK